MKWAGNFTELGGPRVSHMRFDTRAEASDWEGDLARYLRC